MPNITGTDGNDVLNGTSDSEFIFGYGGDDVISGGEGNDTLYGGDGNDVIRGGNGANSLYGEAGDDTIILGNLVGNGTNYAYGGTGNDKVTGGSGRDYIVLGDGNDSANGGGGNDQLQGDAGNDTLDGASGDDYVYGGTGNNVLYGGDGDDTLTSESGNNLFYGGSGNDRITASVNADGDDIIDAGGGNNTIDGGGGHDTVVFAGKLSDYSISFLGPEGKVKNLATGEINTITRVELLKFADQTIPFAGIDFLNGTVAQKQAWVTLNVPAMFYASHAKLAGSVITYSFESTPFAYALHVPAGQSYAFKQISAGLQQFYRETFDYLGSVLNVEFKEVSGGSGAQIKIGQHNMSGVDGYSFPPNAPSIAAGWLLISSSQTAIQPGEELFWTALHELGHVLGLDHTANNSATGGGSGSDSDYPDVAAGMDSTALSVMSYQNYTQDFLNPVTFMALDMAALKALYGERVSTVDSTYLVNRAAGSGDMYQVNQFGGAVSTINAYAPAMISDSGGNDLIDLTGYKASGVTVDLSRGAIYGDSKAQAQIDLFSATPHWIFLDTSPLVTIDPYTVIERIRGSMQNDVLLGSRLGESLDGSGGNDTLNGGGGNDTLDGGAGQDTAQYSGLRSAYTLKAAGGTAPTTLTDLRSGGDGSDSLSNIERLQFFDQGVALDLGASQAAGKTVLMMAATLGPAFPADKGWAGTFLRYFDGGATLLEGAALLVGAGIIAAFAGGSDNASVVKFVYNNVFGHLPDAATLQALVAPLEAHTLSQQDWLASMAASTDNQVHVNLAGYAQSGLDFV